MTVEAGPNIVNDGLILNLDAANSKSYPGTGATWTDLSGLGNNSTLENSPTYSSLNNGSLAFNGSTTRAIIPNNTALDTQTPSVEVWIKTNALSQNGFWFEKGDVNTQYSLFQNSDGTIYWRQNIGGITNLVTTASSVINATNWFQVVGTYTSGVRRLYVNGTLVNSDTQSGTIATNSAGMSIGVYGGFSGSRGYYYNGNLSTCRVYNKSLSAAEVMQNFNALRGRYGI
jgi:hypothetical protein